LTSVSKTISDLKQDRLSEEAKFLTVSIATFDTTNKSYTAISSMLSQLGTRRLGLGRFSMGTFRAVYEILQKSYMFTF